MNKRELILRSILFITSFTLAQAQTSPESNIPGANTTDADVTGKIPLFRNHAEVALVPVVVRDRRGSLVTGLTKGLFRLQENGVEREISSFEEIKRAAAKPLVEPPDVGYSNLPLDAEQRARVTIVVLDLINTNELQRTDGKERLIRFFSKDVPPGEPVSLLCLTYKGVKLVHPFTADPTLLVQALRQYKIEGAVLGAPQNQIQQSMRQFREIARAYAGVPGRKTLLWVTGFVPSPYDLHSVYVEGTSDVAAEFEQTWKALLSANVAVYPVGLLVSSDPELARPTGLHRDDALRSFAATTGGAMCEEDNRLAQCFRSAIEDSRSYYLLSYALPQNDREPGWRKLRVKVSARSVDVRSREGFYYEPSRDASVKTSGLRSDEVTALASSLAASGVVMNIRTLPTAPQSLNADGGISKRFLITISLDSITVDKSLNPSLNLDIGAVALDKNAKNAGEFLHVARGNPNPEALKRYAHEGIQLEEKLDLAPGAYDMRFVVRDNSTGKIGTVVFPLEVK